MRVAAFTRYGREAASTRQRLLQYVPRLEAAGIEVAVHPLLDDDYVRALARGESYSKARVLRSYTRRLRQILEGSGWDLVWIYAELFPYLPAAFELLAFRGGSPVVYDFDDAFFMPYEQSPNPLVRALLSGKLKPLIQGAAACCCGNQYLREYALQYNSNALVIPTVVDTELYRPAARGRDTLTIGWIGSPSTWPYVRPFLPLIRELCSTRNLRFSVVGAGKSAEPDRFTEMEIAEWSEATEVAAVQAMDIGIMPLPDEPWARGKSGYKLVQYMACGLPVIASPIGANSIIVRHETDGYLARTNDEWRAALEKLISGPELRSAMGSSGRLRVIHSYSLAAQAPRLIDIFRIAATRESVSEDRIIRATRF